MVRKTKEEAIPENEKESIEDIAPKSQSIEKMMDVERQKMGRGTSIRDALNSLIKQKKIKDVDAEKYLKSL